MRDKRPFAVKTPVASQRRRRRFLRLVWLRRRVHGLRVEQIRTHGEEVLTDESRIHYSKSDGILPVVFCDANSVHAGVFNRRRDL